MKNIHIEYLKRRAKEYHRTRRRDCFRDGMLIFHEYGDLSPDRLTWWNDVTFIMNDYRVALAWTHPRMAYEDTIDTEADRLHQWEQVRHEIMQSANIEIKPSLGVRWCRYSRLVNLCAPVEVRDEDDLTQLVALTRRLVKREMTLSDAFPGYCYTRADWEQEHLHIAGIDLHVHKLYS